MSEQPENADEPAADPVADLEGLSIEAGEFEPTAEAIAPEPEPEPEIPTDQVVLMVIGPLFDVLAPAWNVTTEEKQALSKAYGDLIDKYFPDVQTGPEVGAILVTGMVLAPRIGQPLKNPEHDSEPGREQGGEGPGDGG